MTEVEPVKTVTLNDTQYNVDDMSDRGSVFCSAAR